jgi:hypothetical protein
MQFRWRSQENVAASEITSPNKPGGKGTSEIVLRLRGWIADDLARTCEYELHGERERPEPGRELPALNN